MRPLSLILRSSRFKFFTCHFLMPYAPTFDCCHLLANSKICKSHPMHFCASSHRLRDINVSNLLSLKRPSMSLSTIFAMTPIDGKCQIYKRCATHFCTSSNIFRDLNVSNGFLLSKSRSRSRRTIFAMTSFDGKYQNLQKLLYAFLRQFSNF